MAGRAKGLEGWPSNVVELPTHLRGMLLSSGYLYVPWPRFSLACPNETLSRGQCNRGLAMAGLGGLSTMRHRAVLRQARICAILLSLGKELMLPNVPKVLRADLLTPTCPLRSTPFRAEAAYRNKFLLEVILGSLFGEAKCLTWFG